MDIIKVIIIVFIIRRNLHKNHKFPVFKYFAFKTTNKVDIVMILFE